jgi:hypothetical protein
LQAGHDRHIVTHQTKPKIIKFAIQNSLSYQVVLNNHNTSLLLEKVCFVFITGNQLNLISSKILTSCKHKHSHSKLNNSIHQSLLASEMRSLPRTNNSPCILTES